MSNYFYDGMMLEATRMIKIATWTGKIATSNYEHAEQGSQYVMEYGIEHDFNGSDKDYTFVMVTNFEKPRAEKAVRKVIKGREDLNKELEILSDHSGSVPRKEGNYAVSKRSHTSH